jgi:TATA-box binding protein (TBP) (component of TFIID and TFIIIB)
MRFTNFRLQNVVGSTDVGFAIRLEGLASEWEGSCSVRISIASAIAL